MLSAHPFLGGESTINRNFFDRAVRAEGEEAAYLWRACLQAGDQMAHYGLGYRLYELGRHREAYRHLRAYTEIVPSNPWGWCWLGRACEAIGDLDEARSSYKRAVELEAASNMETDAPELLKRLEDDSGGKS